MLDPFKSSILYEDMALIAMQDDYEDLRGSTVLVAGATGMLASYSVLFLIWLNEFRSFNIEIYAGVRHLEKAENRFGIYAHRSYFHIYPGDVNVPITLDIKADYIIHAASLASPQYYGRYPVETMLPNIVGMNELMKFSLRCGAKSVLFFSSGAVYGQVLDKEKITEDCLGYFNFLAPGSVYGESKRCGEALALAYCREYNVPVKIVRINHTYGPTLDLENDHRAFAEFVKNVLNGENIVLKSDGKEKRAFCYLSDATVAFFKILLQGQDGESYNLVNEKEFISILELAEMLVSLFPEKGLKVEYQRREDEGYLNLAHTSAVCCSGDKLRSLGFKPKITADDGFRRTIKFFEETTCGGSGVKTNEGCCNAKKL